MKDFEVSILCTTYNHRLYIERAIEGFLNQKTEYNFHIYIHDDASTDGTGEIVRALEQKYPDKITAIIQKENLYSKHWENGRGKYPYLKKYIHGKYVAVCEGDDFWIDSNKLQLQVDYLEAHPDCMMTAHNAIRYDVSTGSIQTLSPYDSEQDISVEETIMWYRGNIPTASLVLRTEKFFKSGIFDSVCMSGDWLLQLNCLTSGKIHYFDRIMSCYRANVPNSYTVTLWGDMKKRCVMKIWQMVFLMTYDIFTNREYHDIVANKLDLTAGDVASYAGSFSKEEAVAIFSDIDYLHQGMSEEQHRQYREYISEIKDVILTYIDDEFCPPRLFSAIKKYNEVYIYGAGCYGEKMLNRIKGIGVDVRGMIVSDGQAHPNTLNGIRIYELAEIKDNLKGSCIVTGVTRDLPAVLHNVENLSDVEVIKGYGLEFDW